MKKSFYCFAVILFLTILYSCNNEEKSDLEKSGFVGNVKSVTTVSYDAYDKFGEGNVQKAKPSYAIIHIASYDSLGNLLVEKSLSINDVRRKYTTFNNNNNQQTKWLCYDDDDDSKIKYSTNYYYDDKGNLFKEFDIHNNSETVYKNTYDSEGHLISQFGGSYKRFWEYSNGELVKYTELFYDIKSEVFYKNGRIYKETHSDDTSSGFYRTPTYDEQGRQIEITVVENDNVDMKIKLVYLTTSDTAPIERIVWNADGAVEHDYTYSYFTVGNDTVTVLNYDKDVLERIEFYLKEPEGKTNDTYLAKSNMLVGYQYIYENGELVSMRDLKDGSEHKYVDDILTITEEDDNEVTEKKYNRNILISNITKDKNGKIKYSYVLDGDDSKKTITIIDNGETKKGEEIYENGKLVKYTEAINGLTSTVIYDKDGHKSEIKNSDGTVWSYKYDYDAKGNWIKEITYKNGKANRITERSIIYYN